MALKVLVLLFVAAGTMPAAGRASDGPPDPKHEGYFERVIKSVELRLPRGVEADGVAGLVTLRVGTKLERRELRLTIRRLYETGRFRQVRAHAREDGEGVALALVLLPRQRLAEISFLGVEVMDDARLRRAAGVSRGDDPSPQLVERVTAAVKRAYARVGYRDVVVRPELREADDGQVALLVRVEEGPPTRLARARWEGDTGLPPEELDEALGLAPGDPIDLGVVEDALDRILERYREAGFLRARVGAPRIEPVSTGQGKSAPDQAAGALERQPAASSAADGPYADLVIPVAAGPLVRVVVSGNRAMDGSRIRALFALEEAGPMDADAIARGGREVEKAYRLSGYRHVEVVVEEVEVTERLHELRVRVEEGPPMRVKSIEFPGAKGISERWMRQQVCLALEDAMPRVSRRLSAEEAGRLGGRSGYKVTSEERTAGVVAPEPCEVFESFAYGRAIEVILDRYRREGWLHAAVGEPELSMSPDRRVAHVTIPVEEGVRSFLSEVRLEGVEKLDGGVLLSAAGLQAGRPFSMTAVEEGRLAIRRLYAASGYPFATVDARTLMSEDQREAKVVYRVGEGHRVSVGRIIVRGHHHTPASLVRSQLTFGAGDVWDLKRVQASQRRILSLGIYRSASVRLLDPDEPAPVMDVVVTVVERRPKAIEMGVGLSTEDGPRIFAEYTDHAFFWSSELRTRAKVNYPIFPAGLELRRVLTPGMEWEAQAGLRLPTLLSARTDVVGERANRPTFGLTRAAWSVGADTRWHRDVTASMGVEMEYVEFERAAPDPELFHPDREIRRFEEGQTLLTSLRPGVVLDLRDRPVSPRRGVLAGAAIDWSHDLGVGIPIHFLKATASLSGYVPASSKVTLALSARGGMVMPLSEDNVTIEPKRFFLGGADTLRGFPLDGVVPADQREDLHGQVEDCRGLVTSLTCTEDALMVLGDARRPASAGGEAFVLFKGELRFPILGGLQGGLFVDAGNLWRDGSLVDVSDLRTSAGGGLRYETPVGPVAVDLGINLFPDQVLNEMPMALHFAIGLF